MTVQRGAAAAAGAAAGAYCGSKWTLDGWKLCVWKRWKMPACLAAFNGSFRFDFFCLHIAWPSEKIFRCRLPSFSFVCLLPPVFSFSVFCFSGKAVKLVEMLVRIVKCAQWRVYYNDAISTITKLQRVVASESETESELESALELTLSFNGIRKVPSIGQPRAYEAGKLSSRVAIKLANGPSAATLLRHGHRHRHRV